jgi:hypothetical protein
VVDRALSANKRPGSIGTFASVKSLEFVIVAPSADVTRTLCDTACQEKEYLNMVSTNKFTETTIGILQHGTYWCVPASIENLLRAEGVDNIRQEDLIYEHLLVLNIDVPLGTGGAVPVSSLQRHQVLEYFKCQPIPDATFQSFGATANIILARNGSSIKLTDIHDIQSSGEYVKHMKEVLCRNKPVLMSVRYASGWHITVVYKIDGTKIWSYDPEQDKHLAEPIANYNFSHDVLYVQ